MPNKSSIRISNGIQSAQIHRKSEGLFGKCDGAVNRASCQRTIEYKHKSIFANHSWIKWFHHKRKIIQMLQTIQKLLFESSEIIRNLVLYWIVEQDNNGLVYRKLQLFKKFDSGYYRNERGSSFWCNLWDHLKDSLKLHRWLNMKSFKL